MKKVFLLILIFIAAKVSGQTYKEIGGTGQILNGVYARELLLPDDTVLTRAKNVDTCQQIAKIQNVIFSYDCSLHRWVKVVSIDTSTFILNQNGHKQNANSWYNKNRVDSLGVGKDPFKILDILAKGISGTGTNSAFALTDSSEYVASAGMISYGLVLLNKSHSAVTPNNLFPVTLYVGGDSSGVNHVVPIQAVPSRAGRAGIVIAPTASGFGVGAALEFKYNVSFGNMGGRIVQLLSKAQANGGGDLMFQTSSAAATPYTTKMSLLRSGQLIVNSAKDTSNYSLDVTGSTKTDSLIIIKLPVGNDSDSALVWDATDKQVKKRSPITGGGGLVGDSASRKYNQINNIHKDIVPIGNIFNSISSGNFTPTGTATFTFGSGVIDVSGGSSNFANYLEYTAWKTLLNKYTLSCTVVPNTSGSGFAIGFTGTYALIDMSAGGTRGSMSIRNTGGGLATSVRKLTFTNGDTILLSLYRNRNLVIYSALNKATGDTASVSFTWSTAFANAGSRLQALSNPTIYAHGGTQTVTSFSYSSHAAKNTDIVVGLDSHTEGYYAGENSKVWSQQAENSARYVVETWARQGAIVTDITARMAELRLLHPSYVVCLIGTNDARSASTSTYINNYRTLTDSLKAIGATPIICHVLPHANSPRNDTILKYNTAIDTAFGGKYPIIDTYGPFVLNNHLAPVYQGDTTHLNGYGQSLLYTTVAKGLGNLGLLFDHSNYDNVVPNFQTPGIGYTVKTPVVYSGTNAVGSKFNQTIESASPDTVVGIDIDPNLIGTASDTVGLRIQKWKAQFKNGIEVGVPLLANTLWVGTGNSTGLVTVGAARADQRLSTFGTVGSQRTSAGSFFVTSLFGGTTTTPTKTLAYNNVGALESQVYTGAGFSTIGSTRLHNWFDADLKQGAIWSAVVKDTSSSVGAFRTPITATAYGTRFENVLTSVDMRTRLPRAVLDVVGSMQLDLGSDAAGDIYYRNSSGNISRLGSRFNGDILTDSSSYPVWKTPSAAVQTSGPVKDFYTDATGADSLYAFTVPASYLVNNGDKIKFTYAGTFAASGATARILGIAAANTTMLSLSNGVTLGGYWKIEGTIIRVSNSVIRFIGQIYFDNTGVATNLSYTVPGEIGGLNLSANGLRLALTVGSPNTNVTATLGSITYVSAAP